MNKNEITVEYNEYDFVNWTVKKRQRTIDVDEMVAHNALLRFLMTKARKQKNAIYGPLGG